MISAIYSEKDRVRMLVQLILVRFSVDIMYWWILSDRFYDIMLLQRAYERNAFNFELNLERLLFSYVATLLFSFWYSYKVINYDKPHELMMLVLMCVSLFPSLSFFSCSVVSWEAFLYLCIFWVILFGAQNYICGKNNFSWTLAKNKSFISAKNAQKIFRMMILSFLIGSIALAYEYNNGFYINLTFDMEDVYEARLLARGKFGALMEIFKNNASYAVMPLLCTWSLYQKKYLVFFVTIFAQVMLFSIDNIKSAIILPVLAIVAMFIINNKRVCMNLIKGFLVLNFGTVAWYFIFNDIILVDALFKRLYFLPAINSNCYFVTVNEMGMMFFGSTVLQSLDMIGTYAYTQVALPFIVGYNYYGSFEISANCGAFGSAYSYGVFGMVVIPIVYALSWRLLNFCSQYVEPKIYISIIIVYGYMIVNSSLTSVLFIYGYFVALLLIYLINSINYVRGDTE